jgi:hypothetical protein
LCEPKQQPGCKKRKVCPSANIPPTIQKRTEESQGNLPLSNSGTENPKIEKEFGELERVEPKDNIPQTNSEGTPRFLSGNENKVLELRVE